MDDDDDALSIASLVIMGCCYTVLPTYPSIYSPTHTSFYSPIHPSIHPSINNTYQPIHIHRILSGLDSSELITQLRAAHVNGFVTAGLDVYAGE